MKAILTAEQLNQFFTQGYVIIKNALSPQTLEAARKSYEDMRTLCEFGKYPYVRIHNAISDQEIHGIEHIFHPDIFKKEIMAALIESRVLEYSQQLLKDLEVSLILNRIHCNKNYGLSGYWHRDGDANDFAHVQSSIHFFDEAGFYILPGSQNQGDSHFDFNSQAPHRKHLPGEIILPVSAGDLMLFHSSIIHRGSCPARKKYQRAQIHLRIAKTADVPRLYRYRNEYWNHPALLSSCDEGWKKLFTQTMPDPKLYFESEVRIPASNSPMKKIRQVKNLIFYYLSAILGENSPLITHHGSRFPHVYLKPKNTKHHLSKTK